MFENVVKNFDKRLFLDLLARFRNVAGFINRNWERKDIEAQKEAFKEKVRAPLDAEWGKLSAEQRASYLKFGSRTLPE